MNADNFRINGYTILPDIFTSAEIQAIANCIETTDSSGPAFRRTNDLFAIRHFLRVIPAVQPLIFTSALNSLLAQTIGPDHCCVKSIYFDKPPGSNWFVAWHQDLTIAVNRKFSLPGFGPWTVKGDQYAVQPPVGILQSIYTIRIHLDDTDESNGALRVLPGTHLRGIERFSPELLDSHPCEPCCVPRGGVMVMRPLLQHASSRSTAGKRRRVIHLEFSNVQLPPGLSWSEQL
ncbi:phytanoyl-CoA dioxygenase family protein [Puia dinghuensis]|uniref:Phytanoyl-CoA dioxygenase n=1 Tax=Puia dinghuensis TaxID=1792502 RepID=A0A8J2UJL7_9BACT|nr:phytanoyl-CoA dioxygenase family protein [Puia dinghuensis]GGB24845.1 phytanoyl-CoA dioxygenase [Puia dinghuensis]